MVPLSLNPQAAAILDKDQLEEEDVRQLEVATGSPLLSRVVPSVAPNGVALYSAAELRRLIEAGLAPQTRCV